MTQASIKIQKGVGALYSVEDIENEKGRAGGEFGDVVSDMHSLGYNY